MRVFRRGGRQLNVSWAGLAVLLICLPILLRLGFWQLERGEFKAQLLEDLEAAADLPVINVVDLKQLAELPPNTKILLFGEYLPDRTTLLDNRYYRGRAGFNVISLFKLTGADELVVVNRGWVPLGRYRYPLPQVVTPEGVVELEGEVRSVPTDTIVLKKENFEQWPPLIQSVDLKQLSKLSGTPLTDVWVLLSADWDSSLKQEWPVTIVGPQRHLGYAVQWFGLAIALVGVMVMAGLKKTGSTKRD